MVKGLKKGCQGNIIATLLQLFEISPPGSNILHNASVLDPSEMILVPRDK